MANRLPNSFCKTCRAFSMKFSNDNCSSDLGDGTRCKSSLHGLNEGDLQTCSVCLGNNESIKCDSCGGFGYEFVGK